MFLLYKLECFTGIFTSKKNRITIFEVANQLLTQHSLYLAAQMNAVSILSLESNHY